MTPSADERVLVGVDDVELPEWAIVDQQVAAAGLWRTLCALPAGIAMVVGLARRSASILTALTAVLALGAGCVTAFGLLATADVLTALLARGPTPERVAASLPAVGLVVLAFAGRALVESAGAAAQAMLKPVVARSAQEEVHAAVAEVELCAFEDSEYTDLLRQCLTHGVASVESSVTAIVSVLGSVIHLGASVVAVGILHPLLAPVVLLAVLPNMWASAGVAKLTYRSYLRRVSRMCRLSISSELLTERSTAAEMRASTAGPALLDEYRRISEALTGEARQVELAKTWVRLAGRTVAGVGTGLAFGVLGLLLHSGALALALAGAAVVAMRMATTALSSTMFGVNTIYENTLYLDLYTRLLAQSAARTRPRSELRAPADPQRISVERVSFTYPGQAEPALCDVSFTVTKGQVIALVGENGSGKTTLAKLIAGLYLPTAGRVCWDDADLATVDEHSIYERIAMVMQDPARWPMTMDNNIRMGRIERHDPGGRALAVAARASGTDALIAELPDGARTVLSRKFRGGRDLSGGQWQRISVARGLYRDAPIVVADEPTAAMDAKAEDVVFRSLLRLGSGASGQARTMVLITHRLANIQHADAIIVMERGRIVEHGTHSELMERAGVYADMFALQAAGYGVGELVAG